MFGNTGNNNNNSTNVNTTFKKYYGELSCMYVGGWNENLSIKLFPYESTDDNGKRIYDFKKKINTALVQDKIAALLDEIDKKIIPAIDEKKEEKLSVGFKVGKDSAVFVEWKADEAGVYNVYFTLYKNIQPDNTCTDKFSYKFYKTEVVENYDSEQGTGDEKKVEAEFLSFVAILRKAPDLLGISEHGAKFQKEQDTRSSGFSNSSFTGGGSGFTGNTSGGNNSTYTAETGNFEDGDMPF